MSDDEQLRVLKMVYLCLPVPLTLASWAVRLTRPYVSRFDMAGLDEAILALRDTMRSGQVMTVDVSEDDGERIDVSVG